MANSDILRSFSNPEMNVNYNHFDRSYHNPFTCKFGMDIPFMRCELDPGDKVQFSVAALVRSMPLTTAAMLRAKMHFEFYFVPFSQLNHNWNDIFSVTNEFVSSVQQAVFTEPDVSLPYLPLDKLLRFIRDNQSAIASSSPNVFGQNPTGDIVRLLDLTDNGYYKHTSTVPVSLPVFISGHQDADRIPLDVNPFVLQAYQKIWNCYHRNHYYDPINSAAAHAFNTDDISLGSNSIPDIIDQRNSSLAGSNSGYLSAIEMCKLRYHQYKKDLFLSALPSRQDGVVSSVTSPVTATNVTLTNQGSVSNLQNVGIYDAGASGKLLAGVENGTVTSNSYRWNINGQNTIMSVLDLRRAEALQNWKETTLRAGKNMNKQMKAHTGFTPKFAMDNYPDFIGSFDTTVSVDEVVSTSDTLSQGQSSIEGSQLGQIAGKGISVTGRNKFRYFARDHGILMGICYILPSVPYNATGINPFNMKLKRSDYYMKEFENCGFVPLPGRELDISLVSTSQQMNSILGYLPYGYESKTNYDRVHGELSRNGSLSAWSPNRSDLIDYANAIPATGGLNNAVRYVNPAIMNPLFAVNADDTEETDQFIVNLYNDIKVISNKSVLGIPNF